MKRLWTILAALFLFFIPVARAQLTPYARVVRLSLAEGQVLVLHSGSDTWEDAAVNFPLQEGDALATQDGLAEVEFENGATAYLAENSILQFTRLGFTDGNRATQLTLQQGAGTFYDNIAGADAFRILTPTFEVAIPERAEFRVDAFSDGAAVEVLQGTVSVSTNAGSLMLEKGQSVAVHTGDFEHRTVARLPLSDDFDQWVSNRSETIRSGTTSTLSYVNSPNLYGLSDLNVYGVWVDTLRFGLAWRPYSTGLNWHPYSNGFWRLDPRFGWIWVSSEPWGWFPYHFGGWAQVPTVGWVWLPGNTTGLRQWQPARVNWVQVGNQIGWVAKSPKDSIGSPANLATGVVTRSGISVSDARAATLGSNEVLAGKNLQRVTPLPQPPADFAKQIPQITPRSALQFAGRPISHSPNSPQTIVFDKRTRTFINANGNVNEPNRTAVSAAPVPQSNTPQVPHVVMRPPASIDSRINRVAPPSALPGLRGSLGVHSQNPAGALNRVPANQPRIIFPANAGRAGQFSVPAQNVSPRPMAVPPPRPQAPRPVAPPPPAAQPPASPHIGAVERARSSSQPERQPSGASQASPPQRR